MVKKYKTIDRETLQKGVVMLLMALEMLGMLHNPGTRPFFNVELRLSLFLARHIALDMTLRQSNCLSLSFKHQKLS